MKRIAETEALARQVLNKWLVNTKAKERASRNGSTVVDISIPSPCFKPVSLSLSHSSLFRTPKQVFFNPIRILTLYHTLVLLLL